MEQGDKKIVGLEEGWTFVATGLAKIRRATDGGGEGLSSEEYMQVFTTVYCMCTQASPHNYSEQLYQRYKEDLDDYIKSNTLSTLAVATGSTRTNLRSSKVLWYVFNELKSSVTRTVLGMIDDEREHKLIDRDLLKNVLAIYVEIGSGGLRIYQVDFEQAYLESTRNYYSRKFQSWNLEYSDDHDYKLNVEECLQNERERVANYLHSSTEQKLNEAVKSELITKNAEPEYKS
ncbi:cullin-1-like [Miscanthus floridulus]|uniref:cullin-1-like n=1 Tax=Miscanthus floridulus TaxID=154761 RepID=UPI003458C4D2